MKNPSVLIAALAALCCIHHSAYAEDSDLSKEFSACMDASGGVTANMLDCIGDEIKLQDARLNKAYQALISELSPARKQQLQEAQRAWIKFRDANCGFRADPDGGTIASVNSSDCVLSSTASRAKELESLGG